MFSNFNFISVLTCFQFIPISYPDLIITISTCPSFAFIRFSLSTEEQALEWTTDLCHVGLQGIPWPFQRKLLIALWVLAKVFPVINAVYLSFLNFMVNPSTGIPKAEN